MITLQELDHISDADVYDATGQKIGSAGQVYVDNESGQPEWVTVKTGMFGMKESFVPLAEARWAGDHLEVPYHKEKIKDAPKIEEGAEIAQAEEDQLYSYYGLTAEGIGETGQKITERQTTGQGVAGTAAPTDDAMTRSEERLRAGIQSEEVGKVRLRKYVVTDTEQVTVPVRHEEVRLEREPITEANIDKATSGPDFTEAEHEVTLHAERPVVTTEEVPVERVRLDTETVTEQWTVEADVRKERIEIEREDETGTTRPDRS